MSMDSEAGCTTMEDFRSCLARIVELDETVKNLKRHEIFGELARLRKESRALTQSVMPFFERYATENRADEDKINVTVNGKLVVFENKKAAPTLSKELRATGGPQELLSEFVDDEACDRLASSLFNVDKCCVDCEDGSGARTWLRRWKMRIPARRGGAAMQMDAPNADASTVGTYAMEDGEP